MKLKLNTQNPTPAHPPQQGTSDTPVTAQTPSSSGILKLKLGSRPSDDGATIAVQRVGTASTASASVPVASTSSEPPKQKRKYVRKEKPANGTATAANGSNAKSGETISLKGSKKRKGETDDVNTPPAKRPAKSSVRVTKPSAKAVANAEPIPAPTFKAQRSLSIKISNKSKPSSSQKLPNRLSIKHRGKPPTRPLGVGYDSEASDAEDDPAIESQFVLRVCDPSDAEVIRKAIEERKIGEKEPGGVKIGFQWFDKDARRALVSIDDRKYAAVMVDLPTVTESMKSWDRKGFYKSADICQMLLLTHKVDNENQARNYALPRDIDPHTFQYEHGLTPPLHFVRKRRFRKRVSYHSIEAMERQVETLMAQDDAAVASGGSSKYVLLDPEKQKDQDSTAGEETDEDAEGEMVDDEGGEVVSSTVGGDISVEIQPEADDEDMLQLMEEFEHAGDEPNTSTAAANATHLPTSNPAASALSDAVAHALYAADIANAVPTTETTPSASAEPATPDTAVGTPGGAESQASESPGTDDDDDDDDDDDEEVDEDAFAAQQATAELREEIADLEREVAAARRTAEMQKNPLLRQRAYQSLQGLEQDLNVKKASLGLEDD